METSVCQRWLSGRHSWRPAAEQLGLFGGAR